MAALKMIRIRSLLEQFSNALEANKADAGVVCGIRDLCRAFAGYEERTAAAFLKLARNVAVTSDTSDGMVIDNLMPSLEALRKFLLEFAKKDLLTSFDSLLDVLRVYARVPIKTFVSAVASVSQDGKRQRLVQVDKTLIDHYVARLEAALGGEKFESLFEELRADARIGQGEAVGIATAFFGRTPPSTSRSKALARVWERHRKLMEFKKHPSTAGRSAA